MDDVTTYDDEVETIDSASATSTIDDSANAEDSFGDQQSRMEGDEPWFSPSEGKVVDKDGNVITDPDTGREFASQEEFDNWKRQAEAKYNQTAKAEKLSATEAQKPVQQKSFESYAFGNDGSFTTEKLSELAKVGSDYKYSNELLPKVDPAIAKTEAEQNIDPIEKVKADRATWETVAVEPLREVRQILIDQGADPDAVDQLLKPVLQKQSQLVETQYQTEYEKALLNKVDGKYGSQLNKLEEEKQTNISDANTERLARAYFPQGGKEQLFALINGYPNEKGEFVRGPSAHVLDAFVNVATSGKVFSNETERASAYKNTFTKIMADPNMSRTFVDLAYSSWLGKQVGTVKQLGFKAGQEQARQDVQRINRTIKTKPASYQPPANAPDEDTPDMLQMAMRSVSGRR